MVKLTPDSAFVESFQGADPSAKPEEGPNLRESITSKTRQSAPTMHLTRQKPDPEAKTRMPEKARFNEPAGQKMKSLRLRWRTPEQRRSEFWGNLRSERVAKRPVERYGGGYGDGGREDARQGRLCGIERVSAPENMSGFPGAVGRLQLGGADLGRRAPRRAEPGDFRFDGEHGSEETQGNS
jgi:hypothetical protein